MIGKNTLKCSFQRQKSWRLGQQMQSWLAKRLWLQSTICEIRCRLVARRTRLISSYAAGHLLYTAWPDFQRHEVLDRERPGLAANEPLNALCCMELDKTR